MEKSKTELYMEKFKSWKNGKENKNVPRDKKPTSNLNKISSTKPCLATATNLRGKGKLEGDKTSTVKPSNRRISKPVINVAKPVPKPKVNSEKRKSDDELMSTKLNKWKNEKIKSEKKIAPSVSKPTTTDNTKYKQVRSRLFDFKNKTKSVPNTTDNSAIIKTSNTDRLGKFSTKNKKQDNQSKKAPIKPTSTVKPAIKRRHSVVSTSSEDQKRRKLTGILKRKSCAGSFDCDFTNDNVGVTKDCSNGNSTCDAGTDDVFVDKVLPLVAMVTPSNRNVRFTSPTSPQQTCSKTPGKTPKTTAARKAALNDWLKAKGKTPSKFRHLMCFHGDHGQKDVPTTPEPQTKTAISVNELSQQMTVMETERLDSEATDKLNIMLDECMTLFDAGCPSVAIVPWLDDIYKNIPSAQHSSRYYICKANVIKSTLDLDAVLQIFEEATINNAQPREELAKCLTETIKYVTEGKVKQATHRSRTPRRSAVQEDNIFQSSSVMYTVTEVTPFSNRKPLSKRRADTPVNCRVVTPVRRSTRCSLQSLPESLKEKKDMYKSLNDLTDLDKENMLFQPNLALDDILATEGI